MAVTLLRVLVLGVIAAAADDVPITWLSSPRALLPCVVPDPEKVVVRRPPPPLSSDDEPRPKQPYLWRKGNEEVKRVLSNGTLEVLRKKDGSSEGVYQCGVRHYAGLVLGYPVNLKFAYLDKYFSVHPKNVTAWVGQSYVLSCDINSGPTATITWQRGSEPLRVDDRYHFLDNQLLILNVTKEDAGLYRCKATNSPANRTRVSYPGSMQVEEYSGVEALKPALLPIVQDRNITAALGETLILACPVTGYPKPRLIWEVTTKVETAELEHEGEVLTLRDVAEDGLYSCRIDQQKNSIKTFNVTVSIPLKITLPPASKQAHQASTVRFNCTATGSPTPTITWYKNGKLLELTGRVEVRPSANLKWMELLIRSVTSDDAGIYQCFAHNGHSVASAWAAVNVSSGMAAPRGLACWPLSAEHVLVKWPPVNNSIAYTVEISSPKGSSYPSQPCLTTEQTVSLSETLSPYKFQVRAYIRSQQSKKHVASGMSNSVTCQGQGVPINLSPMDDGVYVSWRLFAFETPGVKEWILQYKDEGDSQEHNVTLGPDATNYTIPAQSSKEILIRLLGTRQLPWLAQNLSLVPWWSSVKHGVEPGELIGKIDSVEVSALSATTLTVEWRSAEAEKSGDTFVYTVCTTKLDDEKEECFDSQKTKAVVEGLSPSSDYAVRVRAQSFSRPTIVSEFTQPIYVTTLANSGPEPIKDVTYKVVNATSLRVSWNSAIDKYTVYYNSKLQLPINQWSSVDTLGNTALITDVDTSKELYVIVSGYDPVGYSSVLHIPVRTPKSRELDYKYTKTGLTIKWPTRESRVVRYSQNLTQPLDQWTAINATGDSIHITEVDQTQLTYIEVSTAGQPGSQVYTVHKKEKEEVSASSSPESITNVTYKAVNASTFLVSWNSAMDKYTVYYNNKMEVPISQWPSVDTTENNVIIKNMDTAKELYVIVSGLDPVGYSNLLHVPVHLNDTHKFNYTFTNSGLTVTWPDKEVRWVRYSQNRAHRQDKWKSVNVTGDTMHLTGLDPSLFTFLSVAGQCHSGMLVVPPRKPRNSSISTEPMMELTYEVVNGSTLRVSWNNSAVHKYAVYYSHDLKMPFMHWPSLDTTDNFVLITNSSKELYIIVLVYRIVGYSFLLHIPVNAADANKLNYTFVSGGLTVTWPNQEDIFTVRYSQNLTQPLDQWSRVNSIGEAVHITGLSSSLSSYIVVTARDKSARVLAVPPNPDDSLLDDSPESITNVTYKAVNASTFLVSWNSAMDKYTVYYNNKMGVARDRWPSVDTVGNSVMITNVDTSKELHVIVLGYDPVAYSPVLHIPAKAQEPDKLTYEFTSSGLLLKWPRIETRIISYSQNITQPLEQWIKHNITDRSLYITELDPLLPTHVMCAVPRRASTAVLTVPPRPVPPSTSSLYLAVAVGCGVLMLVVVITAGICVWRLRKRRRPAGRSRRRSLSASEGNEEEMTVMRSEARQLANGGTSKDAGEPLLNGHVHITENPIPLKTPNGRLRRGHRYEPTFDMSRDEEADVTAETVLDTTTSTAVNLFDTSRALEYDVSRSSQNLPANNSFNKFPDDNMNSELTRSTDIKLDNSKILPTLQPNG